MYSAVWAVLLAFLLPWCSWSHPQCLDSQPPFRESSLSLCKEYAEFGCCVAGDEASIRESVDTQLATLPEPQRQLCEAYLKNVSCLPCSPYAAHIFETEGGGEPRTFPELCGAYCREAYLNCRAPLLALLGLRPWEDGLVSAQPETQQQLEEDAETFCKAYIPEDSAYCYPEVLDGPDVEGFSTEQVGELGCLCGEPVARGLRNPLAAVHAGDGSGRLFIVEQIGVIHVLDGDNNLLPDPFLDINVLTSYREGDERGLLGLAFHPNHSENGLFYVYYSSAVDGRHFSILSEFRVNASNGNTTEPNSERELLKLSQPYSNHNGGQLLFKDGYLFVSLGDGGRGGDPLNNGLDLGTLLGSVLRIDVNGRDSGKEYAVPPDNPFVGEADARGEIWAYGLRNPWRCSVDRGDPVTGHGAGRLFCGDVGQDGFEEIDIIEKGGNYGWRGFEGNACFDQNVCSSLSAAIPPIDAYPHSSSFGMSVTGGYVYRGCVFPNLQGLYIFGDYSTGRVFALREKEGEGGVREWERSELCMGDSTVCTDGLVGAERERHILSFGEDEDGELYILTTSYASPTDRGGVVYHLVDPSRRTSPSVCEASGKLMGGGEGVEVEVEGETDPTGSSGSTNGSSTNNAAVLILSSLFSVTFLTLLALIC